jgi:hypothetical protein
MGRSLKGSWLDENAGEMAFDGQRTVSLLEIVALVGGGLSLLVGGYFLYQYFFPVGAIEFSGRRWRIDPTDKIWLARMAFGEAGENIQGAAAVLWSVASRWVTKPVFQNMTFVELMRNFSTPVMFNCRSGDASYCQRISNLSWGEIPLEITELVEAFVKGRVSNPVSGYNNFAAQRAIRSSSLAASELPPITVGGNTFIRDPGTISGEVRIV